LLSLLIAAGLVAAAAAEAADLGRFDPDGAPTQICNYDAIIRNLETRRLHQGWSNGYWDDQIAEATHWRQAWELVSRAGASVPKRRFLLRGLRGHVGAGLYQSGKIPTVHFWEDPLVPDPPPPVSVNGQ
jgi:hypothetical protein